jgi:hypothetical protein
MSNNYNQYYPTSAGKNRYQPATENTKHFKPYLPSNRTRPNSLNHHTNHYEHNPNSSVQSQSSSLFKNQDVRSSYHVLNVP